MPNRPADHRSFNERVYPVVDALKKLGHRTIMPDHPEADDDAYVHWLDAATEALTKIAETDGADALEIQPPAIPDKLLQLQCVVGDNLRRLSDVTGVPVADNDDVGQQLDGFVDEVIELVRKIVERNEELANQLEDCNAGMAQVRSLDKPHNPRNPAHRTIEDDVPVTGRASNRRSSDEEREPIREEFADPLAARNTYPETPAARHTPGLGLTRQVGRRRMAGPWH